MLRLFAGRRVRVAPGRAVVVAVAIRSGSEERGPLPEEISRVHQEAAARGVAQGAAGAVPLDLDEYECDVVAEREILEFPRSPPVLEGRTAPPRGGLGADAGRRRARVRRELVRLE